MYKVFFNESCFLLSDDPDLPKNDGKTWLHQDLLATRKQIFRLLEQDSTFHAKIYHPELERLFYDFKAVFTVVGAAGGAVIRGSQVLMIKRGGLFDLPKGHIEKGEETEACALREVEEECGVKGVAICRPLSDTWHIYYRNERWHLKQTHWFTMSCPEPQQLTPQTEEDIEEVFWQEIRGLDQIEPNTHASLLAVFEEIRRQA